MCFFFQITKGRSLFGSCKCSFVFNCRKEICKLWNFQCLYIFIILYYSKQSEFVFPNVLMWLLKMFVVFNNFIKILEFLLFFHFTLFILVYVDTCYLVAFFKDWSIHKTLINVRCKIMCTFLYIIINHQAIFCSICFKISNFSKRV